MTINTQITFDNGSKTSNTICGEKHKSLLLQNQKKSTLVSLKPAQAKLQELEAITRDLPSGHIPGFCPIPLCWIEEMMAEAGNLDGLQILAPSAGNGAILDYATENYSGITTEAYEVNESLANILRLKGYGVAQRNFLAVAPAQSADVVLMNPPHEHNQDLLHVQHAYQFLKPGGRLIAAISAHVFREPEAACEIIAGFKEWFASVNGRTVDLPADSFKPSKSGIKKLLVVIDAPKIGTSTTPAKSISSLDMLPASTN